MKTGKRQILKILSAIGLFGVFALLCFTNAYAATSYSVTQWDGDSYESRTTDTIYGDATHETTAWQALDTYNVDNEKTDEYGVFWSRDGGETWGHEDLYVGDTVTFQFNMHKDFIGTHYADHLKAWVDWDNDGTYDNTDQIAYLERKLTDNETVSTNPSTSYVTPVNPNFFTSQSFTIDSSNLDGFYLRARVTCSESLLYRYYKENSKSRFFSDDDQFEWNDRESTSWWTSYENMFAATGNYWQGEVEQWHIGVSLSHTPEPATMMLFGFGLLGIARIGRKRKQI
ncbi:hypothetical protein HRM2_19560 [Desulforapulum autotrophicum HRM2]|uniref:Ice-binding protein C-terminal domain-containing protein n=1 Tax=Desulforapulum autotrophicum (strain ATCC 43914 / DSM 3382 / VKM B-1955 / HRM2) TaxID=177437 RepID=C0QCI0_DESAH|nr:PEP-CTERM sorting domain-containing protein [Desulforapulum autotrophicum]ACN15057.1 hypothetical protein HRM2_19560 [Desulforapulum autotrophicum HRM2]